LRRRARYEKRMRVKRWWTGLEEVVHVAFYRVTSEQR
jgi:hypothetical protein